MVAYILAPVSINDSQALSRNNMSAFWEDPNWVITWRNTSLESHIDTVARRYPRRLISNRATSRHQKAIDPQTGRLLGYARWILPDSYATTAEGKPAWDEAMGPLVTSEEEEEIKRVAEETPWNPDNASDPLDDKIALIKKEILSKKAYLVLDYLAVHPENQGKGIGTFLVESGLKEAEKLGLDTFVLAFRRGWGLYNRAGFRVEQELIQDDSMYGGDGNYGVRFMIHEQLSKTKV